MLISALLSHIQADDDPALHNSKIRIQYGNASQDQNGNNNQKKNNLSDCISISKTLDENGNCVCRRGYFHDEPMSERGCWQCHPSCRQGAFCDYPGVCKCLKGYVPGEFFSCVRAIPDILSYVPQKGRMKTTVNFTIRPLNNFTAEKIYCRFNTTIADGILLGQNVVQCRIPRVQSPRRKEILSLALSYDGGNFSSKSVPFEVVDIPAQFSALSLIFAAVTFAGLSLYFLNRYRKYSVRGKNEPSDVGEPLLVHESY